MKNKKAFELTLGVLVVAIILIVTALVVIGSFTNIWAKGTGELRKGTVEYDDGDTIPTIFDKCPCEAGIEENQGCLKDKPIPKTPEEIKLARKCLETESKK